MLLRITSITFFVSLFLLLSAPSYAAVPLNRNVKLETMLPGGHFFYSCQVSGLKKAITIEVHRTQTRFMATSPVNSSVVYNDHPHKAANEFCDLVDFSLNR